MDYGCAKMPRNSMQYNLKMNFGFPTSTNYAQSQVSSSTTQFETNYTGIENGGLFSRDECRSLARYNVYDVEKSLKPTTAITTAYVRLSKLPNGSLTVTEP